MTELFQQLLDWVNLHPYWSGALIFCVAMAESLAIVGMVVPGVAIMFGIGAMIAAGAIDFGAAMAWAVAGAVAGDGVSFWLGRHYQRRLTTIWPFTRYPQTLTRGIAFFEKYGGKSVAIGRFFGPVRAVIPLVAGMMGMSPGRFAIANIISALVWAPAYLLPGVVFGSSLKLASEVALRLVIILLILVTIVWFVTWLIHRIFNFLQPRASLLLRALLSWGRRHPLASSTAAALADPDHPEARGLSILATLLLSMALLFALVTGWSLNTVESPSGINATVLNALQSLRSPWADNLLVATTALADGSSMALLVVIVLAFLLLDGAKRTALYWLAAAGFALITTPLLKLLLQVPRPEVVAASIGSYAFPSGHTLWATVVFGFLAVLTARGLSLRWRWLPYSLAGMLVAGVAFSRLYLGVHWLSDVLGSLALGLAWVAALGIAYSRHTNPVPHPRTLSLSSGGALILIVMLQLALLHSERMAMYAPLRSVSDMPTVYWWQQGWRDLPRSRQDTRSRKEYRFRLQYGGSLEALERGLGAFGWQAADPFDWRAALKHLSPDLPLSQLPLLPQVHAGHHEELSLVRMLSPERRLVLRLWSADRRLVPERIPLWIGVVNEQQKSGMLNLFTYAITNLESEEAFAWLHRELPETIEQRLTDDGTLLIKFRQSQK